MRSLRLGRLVASAPALALLAWSAPSLACGAPFGTATRFEPAQTIVVRYQGGVERYEFNPKFCGKGADFGLLLPIPAPLEGKAELASTALRDELDAYTAPDVVTTYHPYCPSGSRSLGGAVPNRGFGDDAAQGGTNGVAVVDAGRVGFLDYEVLKADDTSSLTDFLEANKYPYDSSALSTFAYYVSKGSYFVAFKVSAGENAPPAGRELCGSLGPIALSFATKTPVVPARIVGGSGQQNWRIYAIADENREPAAAWLSSSSSFSGALTAADLQAMPTLAGLAKAGQRVTRHEVFFSGSSATSDLVLVPSQKPTADYRLVEYRYESVPDDAACSGCAVAPSEARIEATRAREGLLAGALVALAGLAAKRARRRS
jgi:hypothetical protein